MRRFGLGLQLALLVSCGVASGYAWRAALVPKRTAVRVVPATLPYEPAPLTRLAPRPQSAPTHVEAAQQPAHAKPHSPPHAQAAKTEHRPPTAETALASVTPSVPATPPTAETQPQSPPTAPPPHPPHPPSPPPKPPSHTPTPPQPNPPSPPSPPVSPNVSSKKEAQAARKAEFEREKEAKKAAQAARKAEFQREKEAKKAAKQAAKAAKKARHGNGDQANDEGQGLGKNAEAPKQNGWSKTHGPKNK